MPIRRDFGRWLQRFLCWLGFHEIPELPGFYITANGLVAYRCARCGRGVEV